MIVFSWLLSACVALTVTVTGVFAGGGAGDLERLSCEENEDDGSKCSTEEMAESGGDLIYVDFEIFGRVQGVFFRKYTQNEAKKLGLRGFCRNTSSGTVEGSMEGSRRAIDQMKYWLEHTGSPQSSISQAVFKNEKKIDKYSFPAVFDIARTV